jgi:hypothetical protein
MDDRLQNQRLVYVLPAIPQTTSVYPTPNVQTTQPTSSLYSDSSDLYSKPLGVSEKQTSLYKDSSQLHTPPQSSSNLYSQSSPSNLYIGVEAAPQANQYLESLSLYEATNSDIYSAPVQTNLYYNEPKSSPYPDVTTQSQVTSLYGDSTSQPNLYPAGSSLFVDDSATQFSVEQRSSNLYGASSLPNIPEFPYLDMNGTVPNDNSMSPYEQNYQLPSSNASLYAGAPEGFLPLYQSPNANATYDPEKVAQEATLNKAMLALFGFSLPETNYQPQEINPHSMSQLLLYVQTDPRYRRLLFKYAPPVSIYIH